MKVETYRIILNFANNYSFPQGKLLLFIVDFGGDISQFYCHHRNNRIQGNWEYRKKDTPGKICCILPPDL